MSKRNRYLLLAALIVTVSCATARAAVWTGLGDDDRWASPGNWLGGVLPTASDSVTFDDADWTGRQQSVTIDSVAEASQISFLHYGSDTLAFQQIFIRPGGSLSTSYEYIDQSNWNLVGGGFEQSGGVHTVNGDFYYRSWRGDFLMSGGEWNVSGILDLSPETGSVRITGGTVTAGTLELGAFFELGSLEVGGTADVHVTDMLHLTDVYNSKPVFGLSSAVEMLGADFANECSYAAGMSRLSELDLLFDGGLGDVSLFEVAGTDYGTAPTGWMDNFAIGDLWVGGNGQGQVKLVNDYFNGGDQAVYVDRLYVSSGSVLDLNGYPLYYKYLVDEGGSFLNGEPTAIPEPGTLFLLGSGLLAAIRKR